jgi:hypothetical protein
MYQMDSSADDEFFMPIVQVLRLKKMHGSGGSKWVVALSDSEHFIHGECSPDLTRMIHEHMISQNAIVRVRQFAMSTRGDRRVCQLYDVEQVAPNPGCFYGTPSDIRLRDPDKGLSRQAAAALRELSAAETNSPDQLPWKDDFFSLQSAPKWQYSHADAHYRGVMIGDIERELVNAERAQRMTLSGERSQELSALARRWELKLYEQARSLDEYVDTSTFMDRLEKLSRRWNSWGEISAQQHYRLHLLRHAISCKESMCTVTPLCRDIQDVWDHLQGCSEENCQVPFCSTMRRLMFHSKSCSAIGCKICEPSNKLDGCAFCEAEDEMERAEASGDYAMKPPTAISTMTQEYLLIMLHASTCPHEEDGECLISPLCFDLKKVWMHRVFCNTKDCTYPFCASSREMWDHFQSCEDVTCPVCPSVRSTRTKFGINQLAVCQEVISNVDKVAELSPTSSEPDVVASQIAIYEEIQKRNKRNLPASNESTSAASSLASDSSSRGDDRSLSSDGSSRHNNGKRLSHEQLQIREYERLQRAHQLRLQKSASAENKQLLPPAEPEEKDASLSSPESDRNLLDASQPLEIHASLIGNSPGSDKKPSAKSQANGDKKLAPLGRQAPAYYGTTYATRHNTKPVACGCCHANIFIPSIAQAYSCQACSEVTTLSSEIVSTFEQLRVQSDTNRS